MATDAAAEPTESFTEQADAYSADREAQFLEIAGEVDGEDDGVAVEPGEAVEPAAGAPADVATPATATEDVDPLASAKPLDYTVDGAAKAYEGIRVLSNPDGTITGAIIQPDAIKDVQYRLQRGEYLETQNTALYQKAQEIDRLSFKGPDGTEHRGMAAVQQFATENARLSAAVKILAETIENPEKLLVLAYAVQEKDPTALSHLTRELGLTAREATYKVREQWGQRVQDASRQSAQQNDVQQVTRDTITASVDHWAQRYPALTKEDREAATRHLTRLGSALVHQATPEQALEWKVKPGELVIHHDVVDEYLKDRAALRSNEARAATTAQTAATENAARLAAAARGGKGKPKLPATKPAREAPVPSKADEWQDQRLRMLSGQFSDDSE